MTTVAGTEQPSPQAASLKAVGVEDLPLCGKLRLPLRDHRGTLLLAAGAPVTPRFLQQLRLSSVTTVWIHEEDVKELPASGGVGFDEGSPIASLRDFNTAATQKLDRDLQKPGMLDLVITGSPFSQSIQDHGANPYDPNLIKEVSRLQEDAVIKVGDLLEGIRSIQVAQQQGFETGNGVVQSYMGMLQRDRDLLIGSVARPDDHEYVLRHSLDLCALGTAVAAEMGLDERNTLMVGLTGLVHDVGMLKVPDAIRNAPRRLNRGEFVEVMKHVVYSADMLLQAPGVPHVTRVATYQVHERYNGSGYPRGREGRQIHPYARVLGVVDAYLAMISARPFRPAMLPYKAMELLLKQTGKGLFEPLAARALLHVLSLFPVGSFVILSDNRAARVIRTNHQRYDRPVVEIVCDADGNPLPPGTVVDLAEHLEFQVVQAIGAPS